MSWETCLRFRIYLMKIALVSVRRVFNFQRIITLIDFKCKAMKGDIKALLPKVFSGNVSQCPESHTKAYNPVQTCKYLSLCGGPFREQSHKFPLLRVRIS